MATRMTGKIKIGREARAEKHLVMNEKKVHVLVNELGFKHVLSL